MLKVNFTPNNTPPEPPIQVEPINDSFLIDGALFDGNIHQVSDTHFHIIWKHKSYDIHVVDVNKTDKTYKLLVNGTEINTSVQDKFDLLMENMGIESSSKIISKDVKAPMPGLIQQVFVEEGQAVKQGDTLVVLVAMKMENSIKASSDATIKSIKINSGQTVEKNQVLMDFQ
jgi:acetyl/propionyl-CoA carboxylase alpha subunit